MRLIQKAEYDTDYRLRTEAVLLQLSKKPQLNTNGVTIDLIALVETICDATLCKLHCKVTNFF